MTNEAATSNRLRRHQQDDETNDNNDNNHQEDASSSGAGGKATAPATSAQQTPPPPTTTTLPSHPVMPLRGQTRPARPNLRRQVVVAAAATASGDQLDPRMSIHGHGPSAIELANLSRLAASSSVQPPKRPAHLPSRYDTFSRPAQLLVAGATSSANNKPNRYSWAQMQAGWRAQAAGEPVPGYHFSSANVNRVVNPMRMVNLSEHTKSKLVKIIETTKRFSEKWFSHVLLLLFLALYACFGAYIFINFEAPTEQWEKQQIIETRQRIVNESWAEANGTRSQEEFADKLRTKLEEYERLLNRVCASGMTSSSLEDQWTFWGALFYSMTVFTTIGYGQLTPITFAGRVATMIYAIFGIPILLMVLADLGKLLTRIIKFTFRQSRALYNKLMHKKTSIRTKKMISDNTNHCIGAARGAIVRGYTHIQPYNKLPHAFAKISSFRDRFGHKSGGPAADEELQVAQDLASTNSPPETPTATSGRTSYTDNAAQKMEALPGDVETTDVIVTPAGQTTPVSPLPENEPARNDFRKAGAENHENAPHGQSVASHHHHHPTSGGGGGHHSSHHHHHYSGAHRGRSQSPGLQSAASKRKSSSGSHVGGHKKSGSTGQNATTTKTQTVSRSSSVSSSTATATADSKARHKHKDANSTNLVTKSDLANQGPSDAHQYEPELMVGPAMAGNEYIEEDEEDVEDDFDIPVSFALFLLVTYMMFGAVVFSIWEGWNFFDSLYFVFISMSTIGFGDLVPQHPKRMIGTFIYLLFGLALTSMCINVVQEKIHATFLRAKMQIGEKMGLDLVQIMADDYYDGSSDEDDLNSMAASQTNSSLACQMCIDNAIELGQEGEMIKCSHVVDMVGETSAKHTRNKDSLRSRRRLVTGLPAHNSGGGGHPLRRSHSKKIQRQLTPSSAHGVAATVETNTNNISQTSTAIVTLPLKAGDNEAPKPIQVFVASETPAADTSRTLEQSVVVSDNKNDEPPVSASGGNQFQLVTSLSSPTTSVNCRMLKSLSSETGFIGNSASRERTSLRPYTEGRPSTAPGHPDRHHQSGRRSADSSRRASVSQELNQLDDLIKKLSHCQSANERFGPLLGIPSSRRSSRTNLSTTSTNNSINGTSQLTRTKRGSSMIDRPSRFQGSSPPSSSSFNAADATSSSRVKKFSMINSSPRLVATTSTTAAPATSVDARQDALMKELEAIKFSAV